MKHPRYSTTADIGSPLFPLSFSLYSFFSALFFCFLFFLFLLFGSYQSSLACFSSNLVRLRFQLRNSLQQQRSICSMRQIEEKEKKKIHNDDTPPVHCLLRQIMGSRRVFPPKSLRVTTFHSKNKKQKGKEKKKKKSGGGELVQQDGRKRLCYMLSRIAACRVVSSQMRDPKGKKKERRMRKNAKKQKKSKAQVDLDFLSPPQMHLFLYYMQCIIEGKGAHLPVAFILFFFILFFFQIFFFPFYLFIYLYFSLGKYAERLDWTSLEERGRVFGRDEGRRRGDVFSEGLITLVCYSSSWDGEGVQGKMTLLLLLLLLFNSLLDWFRSLLPVDLFFFFGCGGIEWGMARRLLCSRAIVAIGRVSLDLTWPDLRET